MKHRSTALTLGIVFTLSSFVSSAQTSTGAAGTDLNTAQYRAKNVSFNSENSDFGVFPYSESNFFFSSNRKNEDGTNVSQSRNWNNQPFLDIYVITRTGDTTYSKPVALPGNKESRFNEGPIFYDPVSSTFFITRNQLEKSRREESRYGVNRLKIYMENTDGSAFKSFGEFQHNSNAYSVGHAALSPDGKQIFFCSDMPGGLGGVDIYVSTRDGNLWSPPKNLGNLVNTPGNEMFPFISAENKLYFSTNGHSTTSGLDIYSVEKDGEGYKNLRNLGTPFNSDMDDFSFYIFPGNKTGFFSSNRPGGKGDDDIYFFELNNPTIKGRVFDDKGVRMAWARVKIMDDDLKVNEINADSSGSFVYDAKWGYDYTIVANREGYSTSTKHVMTSRGAQTTFEIKFNLSKEAYGIEGAVLNKDNNSPVSAAEISLVEKASGKITTTISDDKGAYNFSVKPNLEYLLRVEKQKFVTASVPFFTKGMAAGMKKQNVLLEELVVGKSIKIDNVYYDQGKWDIRADAKPELDKMVTLMNENPSMEVELSSHTDARGSDASNMTLSDNRAKSVVSYIVSKGIKNTRLVAKGYGESKLLNNCSNGVKCSDVEHQVNRRTEFKILKIQ